MKNVKKLKEEGLVVHATPTPAPTPTTPTPVTDDTQTDSPDIKVPPEEDQQQPDSSSSTMNEKKQLKMDFDVLIKRLDEEIKTLKTEKVNVKQLKMITTQLKELKQKSLRTHQKPKRKNTKSGFLKPVSISANMAKFAGWHKDELKSRVDVTRFICDYVKTKNLQNPEDKRGFFPDKPLAKLLGYEEKTPLTYFGLQTHMKKLFK